ELAIVQPSAVRLIVTCSLPIGTLRTKIVRLAGPLSCSPCAATDEDIVTFTPKVIARVAATVRIQWTMETGGTPQHSIMNRTASVAVYEAAKRRAAIVDRSDRARIVISGADRSSYLQGLLTNDIPGLSAGSGCYTAYLTAQGRMLADAWSTNLATSFS